ncbi:MAG: tetratricopeptide repeat protein [bacterium]
MTMDELYEEIEETLALLDGEEALVCRAYLSDILEGESPDEPYEIANTLLTLDTPEPLPQPVRELIETLFSAACEEGNGEAMVDLGSQYYHGFRGFPQDFTKAFACFQLAAAKGNLRAQVHLGYCYYYGRNMPVNYEKAFHCFAMGAFVGDLNSLYKIGDMYQKGYYVERNPVEAFRIYSRCLNAMTEESAPHVGGPVFLRMGNALLHGLGTAPDPKRALVCYQKAETFLYDMVVRGSDMYRRSLQAAIEGQAVARAALMADLPPETWHFDR